MLTIQTIVTRILIAVAMGALIGLERELVGKEAGIRTDILVVSGSTIFTMIGLMLPYIGAYSSTNIEHLMKIIETSRGFSVIASIVTGVGFLGAGVILKKDHHVSGVTTAASIWFAAAVGILVGVGLIKTAVIAAAGITLILFILRKIDLFNLLDKKKRREKFQEDEV
ncbi:MAG TPA: MgtC/SapB family protein [Candidatus Paceibacterota bacterium]|nr:MgtC/SapB family protein [Candidatus Paceibacterota bacterium]